MTLRTHIKGMIWYAGKSKLLEMLYGFESRCC